MKRYPITAWSEAVVAASVNPVALVRDGDVPDLVLIRADQYEAIRWRAGDRAAGRLDTMPAWLREQFIAQAEAFAAEGDDDPAPAA